MTLRTTMTTNMTTHLLPPRHGVNYLPHQVEGIRWMLQQELQNDDRTCRGGILADDMGLGKTFQTIGLIKNSPIKRTLIICPPVLVSSWSDELTACGFRVRFRLPGLPRFSGSTVDKDNDNDNDVFLMTFSQSIQFPYLTRAMAFQRVVLDEGHVIRNGAAIRVWQSCCALSELSLTRWILSATPIQNGTKDFRNLSAFLRTTTTTFDSSIMLRRTMAQLRDNISNLPVPPTPVFHVHSLSIPPLTQEQKVFRQLSSGNDVPMLPLVRYLRLQQFIVHPRLFTEATQGAPWRGDATKWQAFCSVLAQSDQPTIVFCQFRREIDMVCEFATHIPSERTCVVTVCGGLGAEQIRQNILRAKHAAQEGNQRQRVVVVVQIGAGGCGLNLQFCTRILFLSKHWNPAVVHQAVGRAVRIGQTQVVSVHFFQISDCHDDADGPLGDRESVMETASRNASQKEKEKEKDTHINLDSRLVHRHVEKISAARSICPTLYEGFPIT